MSDLNEAVEKAVESEEQQQEETQETTETPEVNTETTTVELSDVEIQQAKDLWKGLKSPETRDSIIQYLANVGGYTKAEAREIVKEATAVAKEVVKETTTKDIITEVLGEEYSHLAEKLGPALDKVFDTKIGKTAKELEEIKQQNELAKIETEVNKEFTSLTKKYYPDGSMPPEIEAQMSKMMDLITPGVDMTTGDYLEAVFYASLGRLGKSIPAPSARTAATRSLTKSKLPSEVTSSSRPSGERIPNQSMSLDDAVQKAAEELSKGKVN